MPAWGSCFSILMLLCLQHLFPDCDLYPAVHISESTCLSSDYCLLKSKADHFNRLFFKFGRDVNKTSLFILIIQHASKRITIFFHIDNRIQINNTIAYKIISANNFLIHDLNLQIPTINFTTAVDKKLKLLIEYRFFTSFLYHLRLLLLIR